jgi:tetratricopeptide (TPR) repeat protein
VGYLGYYFAWMAFSYLIREPRLLVGLLVLWFARRLLPPPGAIFGALGRAGRLREQVRVNRANITARRDLATIYLNLLRPRRAIPLLEEGLTLAPEDAELSYLYGVALHRAGRHDEALARLLAAIERDARLRHGHPYFVAGETLLALKRWDDAADAFERYLDFNSSDVAAHTFLARAHAGGNDSAAARQWLLAGLTTWHGLPGPMKRRQFGAYLRAQWARIAVLHDASALAVALLFLAVFVGGLRAAYPLAVALWQPNEAEARLERTQKANALCGSQQTGDFAGAYDAVPEPSDDGAAEQYAGFSIEKDRIVSGGRVVQEFCLTRVFERSAQSLHAEAVLRFRRGEVVQPGEGNADDEGEDVDDVAGAALGLYDIRLDRGAEATRFRFALAERPLSGTLITLRRRP